MFVDADNRILRQLQTLHADIAEMRTEFRERLGRVEARLSVIEMRMASLETRMVKVTGTV